MKGKAWFISSEKKDAYLDFYKNNWKLVRDKITNLKIGYDRKDSYLRKYMSTFFEKNGRPYDFIEPFMKTYEYVTTMGFKFELIEEFKDEDIICIGYGKYSFFIVNASEYMVWEHPTDYSNIPMNEILRISLIDSNSPIALAVPQDNARINDYVAVKNEFEDKANEIKTKMELVKQGEHEELAEMNKKIEAEQQKIQKMMNSLEEKKRGMIAVLEVEKKKIELEVAKMQRKITIMTDTIYTIECYLGDTFDINKLREGNRADTKTPMVILQKLRYLDEDLAQFFSIYSDDLDNGRYKIFEQLLKHSDSARDFFLPYDKCMTFFKISKDSRNIGGAKNNLLASYEMFHGEKIGFLIRNYDELYIGYTDHERINISEDMFMKYGYKEQNENVEVKEENTSYTEASSRIFIFSILQGLIDNTDIIDVPKPINLMLDLHNPYIIFSYAMNQIKEQKFGSIDSLIMNCNRLSMVGDDILVLQSLGDSNLSGKATRGREDNYANRTHDCELEDGMNILNFIDGNGTRYVAVKKRYSRKGATSNFRIENNEFIDLTYWNSEFVRYYLSNKEVVSKRLGGENLNFAYFARFLKIAMDFLKQREMEEAELIEKYYPELDNIRDWNVLLSHWKFVNRVRAINDFQAKRFAKCLEKREVPVAVQLFGEGFKFVSPLSEIEFRGIGDDASPRYIKISDFKYEYDYENFVGEKDTSESLEIKLREEYLKLEKARLITLEWMEKHSISFEKIFEGYQKEYFKEDSNWFDKVQYRLVGSWLDEKLTAISYDKEKYFKLYDMDEDSYNYKDFCKYTEFKYIKDIYRIYRDIMDIVCELEEEKFYKETEFESLDKYIVK
jgi:hypothetical protein